METDSLETLCVPTEGSAVCSGVDMELFFGGLGRCCLDYCTPCLSPLSSSIQSPIWGGSFRCQVVCSRRQIFFP